MYNEKEEFKENLEELLLECWKGNVNWKVIYEEWKFVIFIYINDIIGVNIFNGNNINNVYICIEVCRIL